MKGNREELTEEEVKLLNEIWKKVEKENIRAGDEDFEFQYLIDGIDEGIKKLHEGLEEFERTLSSVGIDVINSVERLYMFKDVSLLYDYKYIKEIQKSGYGKVMWRWYDILIDRLTGSKECLVYKDSKPVGFLHYKDKTNTTRHIQNIVFLEEYQGQGLGTQTIIYVKEMAGIKGLKYVTLHVRESNEQAIGLYKKQGFVEKYRQKGYYRDTKEDAIFMEYTNTGDEQNGGNG